MVTAVAILATVGVYGLVALLVRMDDLGFWLIAHREGTEGIAEKVGVALVKTLPVLVRALGIIGTIAMILVGGGIYVHNLHFIHDIFAATTFHSCRTYRRDSCWNYRSRTCQTLLKSSWIETLNFNIFLFCISYSLK